MNFDELLKHVGHKVGYTVGYGHGQEPTDIRIQCLTCKVEIADADETEATLFDKFARHVDCPEIVVVSYGIKGREAANASVECNTCGEVIVDVDRDYATAKNPDVHDVEKWPWYECTNKKPGCIGQRVDPKLIAMYGKPICPGCGSEMKEGKGV